MLRTVLHAALILTVIHSDSVSGALHSSLLFLLSLSLHSLILLSRLMSTASQGTWTVMMKMIGFARCLRAAERCYSMSIMSCTRAATALLCSTSEPPLWVSYMRHITVYHSVYFTALSMNSVAYFYRCLVWCVW